MVEALKIKEVDQMIESLQKEIQKPDIAKIKVQTATPERAPQELVDTPENIVAKNDLSAIPEPVVPVAAVQEDEGLQKFHLLIEKISDRNYELGECFTNNITYISYEANVLTWESCADEECKKALKHGYSVIKQLVREIFSFETKIKGVACSKPEEELKKKEPTKVENEVAHVEEEQASSMIEDAEMGGSASCVTNCSQSTSESSKEIDGVDITKEPMVQKAIELFEATKVTIQSKI